MRGFELQADEPPSAGGQDAGPTPTELLLASLASCFTMALVYVANKRDLKLPDDLRVHVVGHHEGPRFARIEIDVLTQSPPSELDRLLERAARSCYVSNTLSRPPEVSYQVRVG